MLEPYKGRIFDPCCGSGGMFVQAELRLKVKKVLKRYGYPPDKQQKATETVLEQAALLSKNSEAIA